MQGILTVRDTIRDFLRKYDEIVMPLLRFICAYIFFLSVNKMYGYMDLFDKKIVIFLLSLISALVSNTVVVLIGGVIIMLNLFSLSVELGAISFILFIILYGMYMRMFPDCAWVLAFVPIMYILKLQYAVPLVVMIFSGTSGIVPAAFGILLYYFSVYVKEIHTDNMLETEDFQAYTYIVDAVIDNSKTILLSAIVFAVVIMISYIVYKIRFDYSWYAAIGIGGLINILFFLVVGAAMKTEVSAGSLILGTLLGVLIALAVQVCKRVVDYSKKESVQFEDDDYYYYVTAVPKYNMTAVKENAKQLNSEKNTVRAAGEENYQEGSRANRTASERTVQNKSVQNKAAQNRMAQNKTAQNRTAQSKTAQSKTAQSRTSADRSVPSRSSQGGSGQNRSNPNR